MNTELTNAQGPGWDQLLTIGALAERTGLSPATLRMWEQRHGFPRPQRLESGHRRYLDADVEAVAHVVRRRDAGVRLDVAIADALAQAEPGTPSVYAELRRKHPHVPVQRLQKRTLLALSWAIEDEFCAKAERAIIFGGFQQERYYAAARPRWHELALVARSAFAFAEFPDLDRPQVVGTGSRPGPVLVPLPPEEPLAREWTVVCDSVDLPAALTAWELPGQQDVPDRERVFESIITVEPAAVRDAARVCAGVAMRAGAAEATPALYDLADRPGPAVADLGAVSAMLGRVLSYVDRFGAA
ncbi:DICT sensory domain-containing protein [Nocardioides sp. URHA0020]|uniref:DICT sensory domain-containing protein n=1 Tax=Nocardioides sp. URHA0020 TaxID=1380392 RepID=UPI0018CC4C9D|nr:DICT sensory domain-containing protein [Nocardioides sp. URHA0020]